MSRGDAHDFAVLHQNEVIGRVAFWMGDEIGSCFALGLGPGLCAQAAAGAPALRLRDFGIQTGAGRCRSGERGVVASVGKPGFQAHRLCQNTMKVGETWVDSVYLALSPADLQGRSTSLRSSNLLSVAGQAHNCPV